MDIDRCNSIFELFTAFNFAYSLLTPYQHEKEEIASMGSDSESINTSSRSEDRRNYESNSFVDIIDGKILQVFDKHIDKIEDLIEKIATKQNSIKTQTESTSGSPNTSLIKLEGKFETLDSRCKNWLVEIRELCQKKKKEINERLPYICFIMANFCLAVLGISISEASWKHSTLAILYVVFLILIIVVVFFKIKDYQKIAKFIVFGVFSVFIFHISRNFINFSAYSLIDNFSKTGLTFLIFSSIAMPLSHFIYYFFVLSKFFKKTHNEQFKTSESLQKDFKELEKEYNSLSVV